MKHKQLTEKRILFGLLLTLLILGFILSIQSAYGFGLALHNIDLGQNIRFLNAEFGLNLLDTTSHGKIVTGSELYQIGQARVKYNFFLFGLSLIFITLSLFKLLTMHKE